MPWLTFDTGALIALQRKRASISSVVRHARTSRTIVLVPANVLAEWWRGGARGQRDVLEALRPSLKIQDVTEAIARLAGEALAWYGRQTDERIAARLTIDATVMATACLCGRENATLPTTIYTSDSDDMARLTDFELFPGVLLAPP